MANPPIPSVSTMRVNPKTLLFESISPDERAEMLAVTKKLVLEGEVPHPYPNWVKLWMATAQYDERQQLLVLSTAFPQRVLLSLIENR